MFSNTGSLSFWLSMFFIVASLIGIFCIYSIIKNKSIENENIDKIIELGKWFIVSVALTLTASIINDGFRERDQDIKEMEVFDRYVKTILEADGIQQRKLLCEYFASVSPDGPIQKSWQKYETIVNKHLEELKEDEKKVAVITEKAEKGMASAVEIQEKDRLEEKTAMVLTQSLVSKTNQDIQELALIAGSDSTLNAAKDEMEKVKKLKYPVSIYLKGHRYTTVVGPFLDHNEQRAALQEIREKVRSTSYPVNFTAWCKTPEVKDGYAECNR